MGSRGQKRHLLDPTVAKGGGSREIWYRRVIVEIWYRRVAPAVLHLCLFSGQKTAEASCTLRALPSRGRDGEGQ